ARLCVLDRERVLWPGLAGHAGVRLRPDLAGSKRAALGERMVADLIRLVTTDAEVELVILAGKGYADPVARAAPRHWTTVEPLVGAGVHWGHGERGSLSSFRRQPEGAESIGLIARQRLAELRAPTRYLRERVSRHWCGTQPGRAE